MRYVPFGSEERGVSVVVGTILLIGLMVVLIGVVGASVLAGDYYDPDPQASLVYDEDPDGSVGIVVEDVRHMSADDTAIRLQGQGHCTDWSGSGDIEKGDVTVTGFNDCPEKLEQGDVIQVIGNGRLIDTYELRGVYPDYGCELFEDELDPSNADNIVIEDGDVVACDLEAEDGSRIDNPIEILDGGKLIGDIYTTDQIKMDDGEAVGEIDSNKEFKLTGDSDVDGDIVSPGDSVEIEGETDVFGSITAPNDPVTIGSTAPNMIEGTIDSGDYVSVKEDNSIRGSIIADGGVDIGSSSAVDGDISATGHTVDLAQDSSVGGDIDAGGDEVELHDGVVVHGDVNASTIGCKGDAEIDGEDCEDYDG